MRAVRIICLTLVLSLCAGAESSEAGEFWSKFREGWKGRSATPTQRYRDPSYRNTNTRNLNPNRSRLPGGRTYYQGRYYGNFNNRFYGPQYGYF